MQFGIKAERGTSDSVGVRRYILLPAEKRIYVERSISSFAPGLAQGLVPSVL